MTSWSEIPQFVRLFAALAFVLALMGGLALALKRLGLSQGGPRNPKQRRLRTIEVLALDGRRRLALIQRDDIQHLVILGPNGETVVETNIKPLRNETDIENI